MGQPLNEGIPKGNYKPAAERPFDELQVPQVEPGRVFVRGKAMDETEYLLSSPENAKRLMEAVEKINAICDKLKESE